MRRIFTLTIAVVLLLVLAGCSSSDPTASDEYVAIEQELAQTEAQLVEVTAERDALAEEPPAAAVASEEAAGTVAPEEIAALIDGWYAANDLGDGSVLDLYVPEGYHLYGDKRIEYDEIVNHLSGGGTGIEHEWITEPLLIAEDDDGRYVVVRGMRITSATWSNASALLFEIVTTPEGELRIVQTAFFYDNEWSAK
jgi:outer membrane murein-binding lipoprotein Lpp